MHPDLNVPKTQIVLRVKPVLMKGVLTHVLSVTHVHLKLNVTPELTIPSAHVLKDMEEILTHNATDQNVELIMIVLSTKPVLMRIV